MLFAGGGTGGHVFPGLAIARELTRRRDVSVGWIGSSSGIEREIVTGAGVPFYGVPTGKLRRYFSLRNISDVFSVISGLIRSIGILRRTRPVVLFSKGGYASVPPTIAAWLTRVPIVTHESDADPGLATRIISRFAARILVAYNSTAEHFKPSLRQRVSVTGNPVREDILRGEAAEGLRVAGFDGGDMRPIVLFLGGSLGARQINELVGAMHSKLADTWRIIHQTGGRIEGLDLAPDGPGYFHRQFFGAELPDILASADLVVCRAGASTLWEAASLGKAMVLIPLTSGSRGDQVRNARIFESAGGAARLDSDSVTADGLANLLRELAADAAKREKMGRNARGVIHIDSTDRIVTILEELIDGDPVSHRSGREE